MGIIIILSLIYKKNVVFIQIYQYFTKIYFDTLFWNP